MATPTTLPASFVSGAVLTAAQMNNLRGAFRILQVVQTVKTDTFATTSTSFVDVTGLSVTITPSSVDNKILLVLDARVSAVVLSKVLRGSTDIYIGDAAGSRTRVTGMPYTYAPNTMQQFSVFYLDSPATTSATTYKYQIRSEGGGNTVVNRGVTDTDAANSYPRGASSITAIEVSA
jgi:hypothetical protein